LIPIPSSRAQYTLAIWTWVLNIGLKVYKYSLILEGIHTQSYHYLLNTYHIHL